MVVEHIESLHSEYIATVDEERKKRAAAIAAERGWLSLAGLYWLHAGENAFGTDPAADIALPVHAAPSHAGILRYEDNQVVLIPASDGDILIDGKPAGMHTLQDDTAEAPTHVSIGSLIFVLVRRGNRAGIRLWDTTSPARTGFTGLVWYPVEPGYRIAARFIAYDTPRTVQGVDVLGDVYTRPSPGYVEFTWAGVQCRLYPEARRERLFFNFRDQTNGDTTYEAGRFLYTDPPVDGQVILDFNRATNPYCAYTDYATCPLPPAQNKLPVRIEAGEQRYPR